MIGSIYKIEPAELMRKLKDMKKKYRQGRIKWDNINASVQSWLGHAKHADTYGLRRSIFGGLCFSKN